MDIILSNSDPRPIYEQVGEALRAAIISGELKPGDPLPSIRGLARDLRISVITTKRAFEELEREGWIETVPGKGSFAAGANAPLLQERRLLEIENHLRDALRLGRTAGMGVEDLEKMLKALHEEDL